MPKLRLNSDNIESYSYDDESNDVASLLSLEPEPKLDPEPKLENESTFINWNDVPLVDIPKKMDALYERQLNGSDDANEDLLENLIKSGLTHLETQLLTALQSLDFNNVEHVEQEIIVQHIIEQMRDSKYSFEGLLIKIDEAIQSNNNQNEASIDDSNEELNIIDLSEELDGSPFEGAASAQDKKNITIQQFMVFFEKINSLDMASITFDSAKQIIKEYNNIISSDPEALAEQELIEKDLICKRIIQDIKETGVAYQFNNALSSVKSLDAVLNLQSGFLDFIAKNPHSTILSDVSDNFNKKIAELSPVEESSDGEVLNSTQSDPELKPSNSESNSDYETVDNQNETCGISNSIDNIPLYTGRSSLVTKTTVAVDNAINKLINKSIGMTDFITNKETTKIIKNNELIQTTSTFQTLRGLTIRATENSFEFETLNYSRAASSACKLAQLKGWQHVTAWGCEKFISELSKKGKSCGIEIYPIDGNLLNKMKQTKESSSFSVNLKSTTSSPIDTNTPPLTKTVEAKTVETKPKGGLSRDIEQKLKASATLNQTEDHTEVKSCISTHTL